MHCVHLLEEIDGAYWSKTLWIPFVPLFLGQVGKVFWVFLTTFLMVILKWNCHAKKHIGAWTQIEGDLLSLKGCCIAKNPVFKYPALYFIVTHSHFLTPHFRAGTTLESEKWYEKESLIPYNLFFKGFCVSILTTHFFDRKCKSRNIEAKIQIQYKAQPYWLNGSCQKNSRLP